MNALAGTKMKVVKGYAGQNEVFIAVERGEVHGNTTGLTNLKSEKAEWVKSGKIRVLLQYGLQPSPDLEGVPSALDLMTNDEDRTLLRFFLSKYQMARVLFAPPGVPADRVTVLRRAFDATMKDPAFLADSKTVGLDIAPTSGEDVAALVAELYATPPKIVERVRSILLAARK
jgi:tripartite-type tricarboxylate transporter receptor subunit TctC